MDNSFDTEAALIRAREDLALVRDMLEAAKKRETALIMLLDRFEEVCAGRASDPMANCVSNWRRFKTRNFNNAK